MKKHKHYFVPTKVDLTPNRYSQYGYLYPRCDCKTIKGESIESLQQQKELLPIVEDWK